MDRPLSHQPKDPNKHCLPLAPYAAPHLNPFSHMGFWVAKSIRRASFPNGFLLRKPCVKVGLGRSARFCGCPLFREARQMEMEDLVEKSGVQDYGSDVNGGEGEFLCDSVEEENHGTSSSSETTSSEEPKSGGDTEESSGKAAPLGWPLRKSSESTTEECKNKSHLDDGEMEKIKTSTSEIEMMKERFSKLLLGEDMSGCGKGVCTALAISNAITNLCATIFGQLWRLEPLLPEKKSMWRREMEWLLCVSDHIVELIPSWQTFPDGSKLEIMSCRPRSDLYINIPALQKLDNMLLEILDGFCDTEFWYVDQGILAPNTDGSSPFWKHVPRQEEKWWLPVPRVPSGGLHEMTRKELQHKRECTKQILKAAMAINSNALAEMEIPESYLDTLPKNGRASLGDVMYRYITSDQFSPECLLDCLDFASEYQALEIANRVEASIYIWRRRAATRPVNTSRSSTKSSWGAVKEMIVDIEKRELLADRAESVLLCLKQRFPGLTQTSLDMSKIQFNKDVGKSILESYSRVLESLASNIVARIDDLLYIDDLTKHSDKLSSVPTASVVAHERVSIPYSVPVSSTPYASAYATPNFLPAPRDSPARGGRTPFVSRSHTRGFGVKKVLTDYLGVEVKGKNNINVVEVLAPIRSANQDGTAS